MENSNFKNYIDLIEHIQKNGSLYLPENFSWVNNIKKMLPNLAIDLPIIQKKSKIEIIDNKKNPIYIQLSDGSKIFLTYEEYKRIKGKPEIGKTMIVTMQRHHKDSSNLPSQITRCEVI
jgi:hypothetical protein